MLCGMADANENALNELQYTSRRKPSTAHTAIAHKHGAADSKISEAANEDSCTCQIQYTPQINTLFLLLLL